MAVATPGNNTTAQNAPPTETAVNAQLLQGLRQTSVPEHLLDHPLIAGRLFFTLPRQLLEGIERHVGQGALSPDLRDLEFNLSGICHDPRIQVGFWNGRPILNDHVEEPLPPIKLPQTEIDALNWDLNVAQVDRGMVVGMERIRWISNVARAYVGWLITNRQFVEEHDVLITTWGPQILEWHLESAGQLLVATGPTPFPQVAVEEVAGRRAFDDAVRAFLIRWRLLKIAALDMPIPHLPLMSGSVPISILDQMARAGGVFSYPDIFPVPARDELRNMIIDTGRSQGDSDHLAEWRKKSSPRNPAKNQLERFARIRTLCHYWRVLHARHAATLKRKTDGLNHALGEYFGVGEKTIRTDVSLIRNRLGKNLLGRDVNDLLVVSVPASGNS